MTDCNRPRAASHRCGRDGQNEPRTACRSQWVTLKSRVVQMLVVMCLPAFLVGCVSYETHGDPKMPESDRAVVEGYWHYRFIYDEDMHIVSVDGKPKRDDAWFHAHSVGLPSGSHWLQLAILRNSGEIARCGFELKFEAQHHYKITGLHQNQFLLAHPATSPFKAEITLKITTPDQGAQVVTVPATCAQAAICRQNIDCPPSHACQLDAGFDFGTCTQHVR